MLSGQCSLIWQYQSFMRDEHFVHMLQQIIVSSNGIKVPFTKFTMFGLTIFNTQIIDIIAFIVMNLFPIMYHELRWSWFCILTSNTANNDRFSWAWWFYDTFALVEKFDLVFDINKKKYFTIFRDEHAQRVRHNHQHGRQFFYYLRIRQVIFSISWFFEY